ncbi:hypothetical protein FOZ61_002761 [Perkinsus olseni]|uniref:Uncharacterized protein n=1 Tax=Perkinsus olseni TaxID=32597 RepID=A0A7J6ME32_PEROL|nr:hypothetical protein FOZ61_002761 [Perkinsus olseni]KAF4675058.1 hypothetical protein FOL46_002973 [Perkinsus olseni]
MSAKLERFTTTSMLFSVFLLLDSCLVITASVTVEVPQGAKEGSTLEITDPGSGRPMRVQVPAGLKPGDKFNVEMSPTVTGVPLSGQYDNFGRYNYPPHQAVIITDLTPQDGRDMEDAANAAACASCCTWLAAMLSCFTLGTLWN